MMNTLEEETAFPLLIRDHSGVRLTSEGERLLPAIQELLRSVRKLEEQVDQIGHMKKGNVRVAAFSSICARWLPGILFRFRQDYPDVTVDIRMGGVEDMYQWVMEDKVDLSFGSLQPREGLQMITLWQDPLVAILPRDHPLAGSAAFPVTAFEGTDFLMPALGFSTDILPVFTASGVHPHIQNIEVDDGSVISMVELGLGLSILSRLVLESQHGKVLDLPLNPPAHRNLGIIFSSLRPLPPMTETFLRYAAAHQGTLRGG